MVKRYAFDGPNMSPSEAAYLKDPSFGGTPDDPGERAFRRGDSLSAEGLSPEAITRLEACVAEGYATATDVPTKAKAPASKEGGA